MTTPRAAGSPRSFTNFSLAAGTGLLVAAGLVGSTAGQDATYSTPGPPQQSDPNILPQNVGYGGVPAIVNSLALESSAGQDPQVHYHLWPSASASNAPAAQGAPAGASTPTDGNNPKPFSPYSGESFTQPVPQQSWNWHYYGAGVVPPGAPPAANAAPTDAPPADYHIHNYAGSEGYIPAIDNPAFGSGAFVGNWDPYAFGGQGYIQGFD